MRFHHIRLSGVQNTMSNVPPSGQWPSYPTYQPNQPYQPYSPYPQPYPVQPQPYLPYQPVQPAPVAQPDEGPLPEMPQGYAPGRYASIFAIVLVVVCLGALVLAALAPALTSQSQAAIPSNWGKVYDDVIRAGGAWDTVDGCSAVSKGLDVQASNTDSGVLCDYTPSEHLDLLRHGFYIQAQVAPAARVAGDQLPAIVVGQNQDFSVDFDQEGNYRICAIASCWKDSTVARKDSTVAWHSDDFVANTIGLLYVPYSDSDSSVNGMLTVFANGQAIARTAAFVSFNSPLALGAAQGGEALFTHVTLYLASAR